MKGLALIVCIGLLLLPGTSMGKVSFEPSCGVDTEKVIKNFAKKEFPNLERVDFSFPVFANDLMCGKDEHMANIAAIVTVDPRRAYHYGIFHIHFSSSGEINSAAAILPWKLITGELNDKALHDDWCNFIRSVYSQELKKQECM